ncbi:metallophosphoesterase [Pseudomonas matsuisoli]|nr:metallophosphoesterase [Pseudomonas matsuisoli]
MLDPARGYDLIGDVHGCGRTLEHLLERMGYRRSGGVWKHPRRMAIFLGDILDRGPRIREALHLVHDMVDAGQAICLMGNHEYDVIGWHTLAPAGSGRRHIREHSERNARIISDTLQQFEGHAGDWRDFMAWFYTLPVAVDAGAFRVVHACWDATLTAALFERFPEGCVDAAFVEASGIADSLACRTFDRLLRGTGMRLPDGRTIRGRDGFERSVFRTKFWEPAPRTLGDVVFQPDGLPADMINCELSDDQRNQLLCYGRDEPALFVGHYWRSGTPEPITPNLACVDYSAVLGGRLVAYRYDGEAALRTDKFVWVDVERPEAGP